MKNLNSFAQFARQIEKAAQRLPLSYAIAMEKSALSVEAMAKGEIGTYQRDNMGPFTEWDEIKNSTKTAHDRAIATGIAAPDAGTNTPELVTGKMRADIGHESSALGFVVGGDEIMLYQELGTATIPPRPMLSPALYRLTPKILNIVGSSVEQTLGGKKP